MLNARERQILINADKHEFVDLSRLYNCERMPIKINTSEAHDKWVYLLARREHEAGYEVIVNGRLTRNRGFPDIASCGSGHRIIEVLWSETLEKAKEKAAKYPKWDFLFFSAKTERFL